MKRVKENNGKKLICLRKDVDSECSSKAFQIQVTTHTVELRGGKMKK